MIKCFSCFSFSLVFGQWSQDKGGLYSIQLYSLFGEDKKELYKIRYQISVLYLFGGVVKEGKRNKQWYRWQMAVLLGRGKNKNIYR